MRLLITGSEGLLGYAFKEVSPLNTIFLSRKDGDLSDKRVVFELFEKYKPTHVIHLAAKVGGVGANTKYPASFLTENLRINLNVYDACVQFGVEKVISFLSTCIFPNQVKFPLTVEQLHSGPPHLSNYGYAYAKRILDIQSTAYFEQYGLRSFNLIGTNIYGPNDNFNLENSHVLAALIHKCYLAKISNNDLVVWGSGSPLREFVYSYDISRIVLELLEKYDHQKPIILSSGVETPIRDAVDLIVSKMNFQGRVIYDKSKPDGQFRKPSENQYLKEFLSHFEFTSLSNGIGSTISWFNENYTSLRK